MEPVTVLLSARLHETSGQAADSEEANDNHDDDDDDDFGGDDVDDADSVSISR